jgi:hypothetical protein
MRTSTTTTTTTTITTTTTTTTTTTITITTSILQLLLLLIVAELRKLAGDSKTQHVMSIFLYVGHTSLLIMGRIPPY